MNIGLLDVDSHHYPNLPLMKLSAYHKNNGDNVEMLLPLKHYDRVYVSKVFGDEYSQMIDFTLNADEVVYGGTGFAISISGDKEIYDKSKDKPLSDDIEHIYPDYSLYPELTKNKAFGFLTRGCCNNCGFCIVSKKEGLCSKQVADLSEFWNGQTVIDLLDANILACRDREYLLNQLCASKAKIIFSQGLDARFIDRDTALLLNKIKRDKTHFAFDSMKNEMAVLKGLGEYNRVCVTNSRKDIVYILVNYDTSIEEDIYRIRKVVEMGFLPDVRVYRKPSAPQILRDLQRWCNNRILYRSVDFKDYIPRKSVGLSMELMYPEYDLRIFNSY